MFKKLLLIIAMMVSFASPSLAMNTGEKAEAFMNDIGSTVITLLTDSTVSPQERTTQFQNILETKFNLKAIGKFVVGRYWKHASPAEKENFLSLFKAATVAIYATRFGEYTSEKFEILGSRVEKDGGVTVLSRLVRPNGQVISIDWKIFEKNGELRIYDVILEGISMSITQRSEYSSVIQKGGGHLDALINALEKKTGR